MEVKNDPYYQDLSQQPKFTQRDGIWLKNGVIFLSPQSSFVHLLLKEHHYSAMGGHYGYHKTLTKLKQTFCWPNMCASVKSFIRQCSTCQQYKIDTLKPAGLLQPLPIPTKVWTEISMDFIEGLPSSWGYMVILVVVDRLSKYAHFIPLKHPFTASSVAKVFVFTTFPPPL